MSTKIYNAYVMTDVPSLYELRQRMGRLRQSVQKTLEQLYIKRIAFLATNMIDRLAMGRKVYAEDFSKASVLSESIHVVEKRNRNIKKTGMRDSLYDFSCDLEIIPIKDKVLVMVFCENRKICKLIQRQKYLRYYGYWNNTDPDEDCTEKEWEQRERDWDRALPGIGVPSQSGFGVQLHPSFMGYPSAAEVLKAIPSFEDRVNNLAYDMAWSQMSLRLHKKEKEKDYRLSTVMRAQDSLKTPKGKALLKRVSERVRGKLPREITSDMLLNTIIKKSLRKDDK